MVLDLGTPLWRACQELMFAIRVVLSVSWSIAVFFVDHGESDCFEAGWCDTADGDSLWLGPYKRGAQARAFLDEEGAPRFATSQRGVSRSRQPSTRGSGAQLAAPRTAGNRFAALSAQPQVGVTSAVRKHERKRRAKAAIRIQACWRRALVRWARPRAAAATRIQAHWRRRIVRLRRAAPPAAGADDGSEYDSENDSDCTSYPVFEETDEILEMTGLELEEESRFGGGFRW